MIENLQLAIDFGLVVLIWMVQLLIYPSFEYFTSESLSKWHKIYTRNITFIVAPMMIIQLIISIYLAWNDLSFINTIYFALVILTWVTTMVIYVPLHREIDLHPDKKETCIKLTKKNWLRVVLWTTIFLLMHLIN